MIIELHPWCCSSPRSVSAIGYTESINGVLLAVADVEDTTDCCKDNRKAEYDENNTKKLYALSPLVSLYRWSVVNAVKESLSEYKPFNDSGYIKMSYSLVIKDFVGFHQQENKTQIFH